jgi:hypothetical protein
MALGERDLRMLFCEGARLKTGANVVDLTLPQMLKADGFINPGTSLCHLAVSFVLNCGSSYSRPRRLGGTCRRLSGPRGWEGWSDGTILREK